MKHRIFCFACVGLMLFFLGCGAAEPAPAATPSPALATPPAITPAEPTPEPTPVSYIDPTGDTIITRFIPPTGYSRISGEAYAEFVRELPLLPHGSPVYTHSGALSPLSGIHAAVLDIDVGERDLQQCADAALRIRCEYLFAAEEYDKIAYHLTNGFLFSYPEWREGFRLQVKGNKTRMVKSAEADESYECFRKYLDVLFNYASTRSLAPESEPIPPSDMRPGDIFIFSGKPGHCLIVLDVCANESGHLAFLLGQSSMPAQQIHVITAAWPQEGPWFYSWELKDVFYAAGWEFPEGSLKRMP